MNDPHATGPQPSRRDVARARQHAAELARADTDHLAAEIQPMLTALGAIRDRARDLAGNSAQVRALGLECLTDAGYLQVCVMQLRAALTAAGSRRRWLAATRARADEVQALLERTISMSSTIDLADVLDVPFDLVTTAQSGAWAGLHTLTRIRMHLDTVETGRGRSTRTTRAAEVQPARPAQWLARTASLLLPAGPDRDRYVDEWAGELRGLATAGAGSRAQLGHAVRLAIWAWELRRALPPSTPRAEHGRVRAHTIAAAARDRSWLCWWTTIPTTLRRWRDKREARKILRDETFLQRRQDIGRSRRAPGFWHRLWGRLRRIVRYWFRSR